MSALSKYMVSAVAAQARINSCSPNIFFSGGETKAARYLSWLLVAMNRRPASLLTARIALDLIGACAPLSCAQKWRVVVLQDVSASTSKSETNRKEIWCCDMSDRTVNSPKYCADSEGNCHPGSTKQAENNDGTQEEKRKLQGIFWLSLWFIINFKQLGTVELALTSLHPPRPYATCSHMHTAPSPHPRSSRSHALRYFGVLSVWPGLQFPPPRPLGLGLLYVYPRNPVCARCFRSSCFSV
jgi:hypothetical protein